MVTIAHQKYIDRLTHIEIACMAYYTNGRYSNINEYIRDGKLNPNIKGHDIFVKKLQEQDLRNIICILYNVIRNAPPLEKELTVYRGTGTNRCQNDIYISRGFFSTSENIADAAAFARGAIEKFILPIGTPCLPVGDKREGEIILLPNCVFKCIGTTDSDHKRYSKIYNHVLTGIEPGGWMSTKAHEYPTIFAKEVQLWKKWNVLRLQHCISIFPTVPYEKLLAIIEEVLREKIDVEEEYSYRYTLPYFLRKMLGHAK